MYGISAWLMTPRSVAIIHVSMLMRLLSEPHLIVLNHCLSLIHRSGSKRDLAPRPIMQKRRGKPENEATIACLLGYTHSLIQNVLAHAMMYCSHSPLVLSCGSSMSVCPNTHGH